MSGNEAGGWEFFSGYGSYADTGTSGIDRIVAEGPGDVDIVLPRFGAVVLLGTWENNVLDFGSVTLVGSNLRINSGDGHDTVVGSNGNDRISGCGGYDQLTGGSERDTFVFSQTGHIGLAGGPHDTITDYVSGEDLIDLAAIDANNLLVGNQAFRYLPGVASLNVSSDLRL